MKGIRVLYASADDGFRGLVETKLSRADPDIDCLTESSIEATTERLRADDVDCVVTAYTLDDGDGIELTRSIREAGDDCPVVLFTGSGDETLASESTRAGVSDYIPLRADRDDFDLLARRVRTLVEAARERAAAERAQGRFERALERTTDAVYAVDTEWRIEYMNERMADRIDRDPETVVGKEFWAEFPTVAGTELAERYRTAMETGESASFEQHVPEPYDYWVEVRVFPDEDGLTVFSREVTEERERERELERNATVLENINDAVLVVDADGVVQYANAAVRRDVETSLAEQLEGTPVRQVVEDRVDAAEADRFTDAIDEVLRGEEADRDGSRLSETDLQIDIENSTGTRTYDVRFTPFEGTAGRQVLIVARDVTDRSAARRQLERERDALQALQRVVADGTGSVDEQLRALLDIGRQRLGLDFGIVSRIEDESYTVRAVRAPDDEIESGATFPLASTYCEAVVAAEDVVSFADAERVGRASHPAYREFELESYIGSPLVVDGERYGTLNFSAAAPRDSPFGQFEHAFVELLAELVSAALARERDRQDLERQQFLFERVQQIADIGIWEYDPATEDLNWSAGVRRIHGVDDGFEPTLEDAIGFYHPDERERISAAVDRAIEAGESYDLDLRIVQADGEERTVRAWGEPVETPQHDRPILRGVFQDITDRERREQEHRALAEEYEALLDTSGDAIFLLDVDQSETDPTFRFRRLSDGYESQTGITTADVRGQTPRKAFGPEQGPELESNYRRCVEQREPVSYREELSLAPDARFWETTLAPVVVDDEVVRLVGIARNVTEQVERERELEATNERLESLIEATPLTIMELDEDGEVVLWNDGAEEMFGWTSEEVLGEPNPMIPEGKQAEYTDHRHRAFDGNAIRGKEVRRETKDGDVLDLLLSVTPITDADGEVTSVLAVLEDITEQKRLEHSLRALQETGQRLSSAQSVESIGEIAVEAAVEVLGFHNTGIWRHDEGDDVLVPLAVSDAAEQAFTTLPRLARGEGLTWQAFEADELHRYEDVSGESAVYNPDTDIQSEMLVPLGEHGVLVTGVTEPAAFSDTDADLFRILGATVETALDRATREATLQRQNERLDQFASVVAHDLRNPLTVAMGYLDVAAETGDPEHFEEIELAHDRMERLIEDLLTLARGETTVEASEQVDIAAVATEAWGYVDTDEATVGIAADVPVVTGDAGRLTQLFENLFRNAVEHGGEDVAITVTPLADADGFAVTDDGEGIPPERRDTVFEHGVTTNEGGTGFGLAIVEDIAGAHGWTVAVTEGDDGGARFEFRFAE
ncbi:PAS domain S-box-containing protein [Haloarchaeobius iranensis]|uniref:histidine kinase n=1 Tax=Haloarchaeobius iranensis TaxID=996166 RepID=A0A1G9YHK9_9EURY|nr:PAS domain S-box-containing protein [Haloarchaeobius iranensis]